MASEPKAILLLNYWFTLMLLKKIEILKYVYKVKGIQSYSNHTPQLFELKKKKQQKNKSRYSSVFFVIFFS